MKEQKNNDLKELDGNIQIYDNDDAYVFGEFSGPNYNENLENNDNVNNNYLKYNNIDKNGINQKDLLQKLDFNYKNEKENNYINLNKNTKNIDKNIQDITFNNKFTTNDDIDYSDRANSAHNIFKKKVKEKTHEDNKKNNKENINEIENNEESNESNIPLVTLNFLSICQCCKDQFNSTDCVPYLFKCGHFFCKKCIIEQFIDEEGIKCPNDGLVAKSISELKILNNFINDKTVTQRTTNSQNDCYCKYHKDQKMTHYIEETKELICIYCAFEKFKQNPNFEIKEINVKLKEIESEINNIIEDNQKNIEIIQNTLIEIKKNKEIEEKKVNDTFDKLIEIIKFKKNENLNKINTLFTENARKLSQKLEVFSNKIEKSEEIKGKISSYKDIYEKNQISNILDEYNQLINRINANHYYKLILQRYKFIYEDEPIIARLINKLGDFKITPNNCLFIGNNKKTYNFNNNQNKSKNNMNYSNNSKNNFNYNHSTSKLNINQNQSRMNINIFTNINQERASTSLKESVIKKKLKNNKSYSNISPFQKNKKMINNISNTQLNSFYQPKIIDTSINENISNINPIKIYNNFNNNISNKNKKLNNTLDFDNNINKKTGIRIRSPSELNNKNKLNTNTNTGIYSTNKFQKLRNASIKNNYEKKNKINHNKKRHAWA